MNAEDTAAKKRNRRARAGPRRPAETMAEASDYYRWAEAKGSGPMILRDDLGSAPPPRRDLMERTARFAESVIRFARRVPVTPVTQRLIEQLVGAATSVGANYGEADDAVSRKDFRNKIGICRKEAKEAMFFLRMIASADEGFAADARVLWQEAKELNLIFGSIWRKVS